MTTFRFKGRAVGSDPTGYYYERWDRAQPITVLAETKAQATEKAFAMLGAHRRFGSGQRPGSGWAIIWDSMDEEPQAVADAEGAVQRLAKRLLDADLVASLEILGKLADGSLRLPVGGEE